MFKFELSQKIYYLRENRVHGAPISSRIYVDNEHQDWAHTESQQDIWTPFGKTRVMYATCHGLIEEHEAFATKEELAQSIVGD